MRRHAALSRRGFALPLVIAVLALGALLVTASFLLGRLESHSGENNLRTARALEAAETGLAWSQANWNPVLDTLVVGGRAAVHAAAVATASWQTSVHRLSDELFLLNSDGTVPIPGAGWQSTRRLSVLMRWESPLPPPAAVAVSDSVTWDDPGVVSGYSVAPAGWASCGLDSVPALRVGQANVLSLGACSGPPCLKGSPSLLVDSAAPGTVTGGILPLIYDSLATRATRTLNGSLGVLGPSSTGVPPVCNLTDPLNWGEPNHAVSSPCTAFFPVVHAAGDLTIGGGRGQGILLVDGDLTLGGGLEYSGLVVVRGRLLTAPGGAHIIGSVAAQSLTAFPSQPLAVDYSACVLRKVLRGPSQAIPLLYRSWAQLY